MELASLGRSCKVERFPHSEKSYYLTDEISCDRGGALEPQRRAQHPVCRRQSGERPAHIIWSVPDDSPQWTPLVHWGEWGLGAEAQVLKIRPWEEDWIWMHGDSLRGLQCCVPQPREYKKPGPTREARSPCSGVFNQKGGPPQIFFLFMCSQAAWYHPPT